MDLQKRIDLVMRNTAEVVTPQEIQTLLEKKITIFACPGCLKAAGKSPQDLMPCIAVADKDKFFNFTAWRILTLDY